MVVPYGAPEYPHPRKFAFDSPINHIEIHYLPGSYVAHDGSAVVVKNVSCIHEEDNGVLWKHTDYRPGGRGQTIRHCRLVVSMVCTLANYDLFQIRTNAMSKTHIHCMFQSISGIISSIRMATLNLKWESQTDFNVTK
ncbi:uncharacterized protein BT62DRAFT_1076552 [Guyanagaster necrorhizus]|uniref:Amine oxidase n=1 Tax=Guyanagaster necrorhizus TaxID=856835 RepID=A0A9P8ATS4_9AGAR|nr:uncharacterized protein BT62DRAFT_1076552 [Guyanagaster necrorhizus MCA 3950]KAG7446167.1 hypothetical protein BT62DRAFT_1076552 [Guyanagaster necrorhizus MCA 3950]